MKAHVVVECDNTTKLYSTENINIRKFAADALKKYPTATLIRVVLEKESYEFNKINGLWYYLDTLYYSLNELAGSY